MNARMQAVGLAAALLGGAADAGSGAEVTPSGPTVPENLLRIELRLSRPLVRPLAMDHVRLLDGHGVPVDGAFLDLPLPAADGRTVTLLLHPARVKTGVGANLALGRALRAGEEVTLVVDDPQLGARLSKRWQVVEARDEPVMAGARFMATPRAGSRASLRIRWAAPLSATGSSLVAVRGEDGTRLAGVARLEDGETAWRFVPAAPWRAGTYAVVVHPRLEDVAGNRPCAPFEARELGGAACPPVERAFTVGE